MNANRETEIISFISIFILVFLMGQKTHKIKKRKKNIVLNVIEEETIIENIRNKSFTLPSDTITGWFLYLFHLFEISIIKKK